MVPQSDSCLPVCGGPSDPSPCLTTLPKIPLKRPLTSWLSAAALQATPSPRGVTRLQSLILPMNLLSGGDSQSPPPSQDNGEVNAPITSLGEGQHRDLRRAHRMGGAFKGCSLNLGGWRLRVKTVVKKVLDKQKSYTKFSFPAADRFCDLNDTMKPILP